MTMIAKFLLLEKIESSSRCASLTGIRSGCLPRLGKSAASRHKVDTSAGYSSVNSKARSDVQPPWIGPRTVKNRSRGFSFVQRSGSARRDAKHGTRHSIEFGQSMRVLIAPLTSF
jgi:hypothetical protein